MANLFSINNGKVTYNKVNVEDIKNSINKKNKITQKRNIYQKERNIQNQLQNNINEYFGKQGVLVNTDNWGNVSRTPYYVQQQSNYTKNGFSVSREPLIENRKLEEQYQKLLKIEDYQQQKQDLINQSNVVGYSKYDYDKAVVDADNIGKYDKTVGRLIEGAKSVFDISGGMVKNKNGDYVYLPNKTELKSQKVNDSYESKLGKFLGNATYEIGKIGGTTLINSVAPYVGSTAYFGRMFMDSTNNAIREGYTQDKAINYGLVNTTLEFVTGKLLGSATKGLTGGSNSQLSNAISNGINKLISNPTISSFIGNAGSEATEEFIQEYLDNINRLITLEGSTNAKDYIDVLFDKDVFADALYSAGIGAVSGGALGSINNTEARYIKQNTDLFKNFKSQLEKTKSNLTNKNEIAKYDKVINSIDEYLKRPFGNEKKAQNILPTVQEVVAQESTKKIDSSTRDVSNNTKILRAFEPSIFANNIAQSNDSVNETSNKTKNITNKYTNITEAINDYANNIKDNFDSNIKIEQKNNVPVDYAVQSQKSIFNKAKELFSNIGKKAFVNNDESIIVVTNEDIKESVAKTVRNTEQKKLLAEHMEVFSSLDKIIENGERISSGPETKNRSQYQSWDYYVTPIYINGEKYIVQFDTVLRTDGEKHFRLERIYKLDEMIKKQVTPTGLPIDNQLTSRLVEQPVHDNNIPQVDKNVKLPVISNNNTQNNGNNTNKIMNPNEISKISLEDANTTPILPNKEVSTGRGESHFAKNIENKTDMLSKESKAEILDSNEVKYYQEITNKGSLEKAFKRLNEGGKSETERWFNKKDNFDDVDVAEGWILLKQYQDSIEKTTNLIKKDELNRSMVQVAKQMRYIGTKAGQTVQAYNILNRLTPEGMVYYAQSELSEAFEIMSKNKTKEWIDSNREQFNLTPQETEFIMKTMQEVQQMEDGYDKRVKLAEIQSIMTNKLPPSKGSGIKAWMRISMLFNPKTQVRNVMGNAIIAPVNVFGDLFASVVDKQIAKKTGVRTTGNIDLKNYVKGFKKGAFQSYNDFKKGINTRNIQGNRFEITEGKSFNDNTAIGKALNRVDSILSFMLDAGDRTFYEATFTNSINNQLKLNNTNEVTQAMIDIATSEALSRTWQDNNGYTKFVLNIRKGLNALNIGGYGLGDVLIPFAKTPANLTKAIVDYSPAGMIKAINEGINLNRSLSNGQYNVQMQHKFVQDLGKATAGTMLYILGIGLAKAGITTGESDDDKDVANFMKNTLGISSYSIKIGNKSFTYDWAQPIAAPLAITANIVQKQKNGASLKENIMSSLDTAGNILLEQSFLESLNTVLSNNEGIATGIQEAIFELPSRAVPTLFKQIADLIDPVQRQSFEKDKPLESAINKVKAKVPILSKTLAPSVDTMGREIQKYGGKNNIFNVFLNPANVNTENISKSAAEIYRLYKITGDATIMPRVAPYNINQNGEKILLSSEQRAEYQEISGDIIENSIKELLNKSSYKNLSDTEKASIINKIVGYSYNKARKEILGIEMDNDYNKINQYIADGGKVSNYYINKTEIDYSYNNPEKYQVITQITTYDKYLTYQDEIDNVKTKYTNSTQRKNAVIKYVNSLNLSIPQKAMLIKLNYSSYDSYNDKIIQYVNKQNLTKVEKTEILTKLGFTIRNGRVYS